VTLTPSYDKSAWNGMGDRRPIDNWKNQQGAPDIIIFEGWCVGFYPIPEANIAAKVELIRCLQESKPDKSDSGIRIDARTVILDNKLQHLYYLNDCLRIHCEGFMNPTSFDACIHLDTAELQNVYSWRLQQERTLRHASGKWNE
jgi:D-glycerate 3-kinase